MRCTPQVTGAMVCSPAAADLGLARVIQADHDSGDAEHLLGNAPDDRVGLIAGRHGGQSIGALDAGLDGTRGRRRRRRSCP
jgi:hypothetical protein